ncbi:hypothetical protein [Hyphomicrobium sp.]|uniref:hypothetical protein n=1 Tax=Hyphomicrobium sp. TaxID=82 RepID=UPI001E026312|nr:hypothetical protein [Hyphomicrobium sp.]MBY0559183.1 hypothetical protein [Hyphomicrobium sp.]
MLKIATLVAALVAASAFVSEAEAAGMGAFYASSFFRNQGRQAAEEHPHCASHEHRFQAFERAREEQLEELRAERAAAAAAAKRARLTALRREQAAEAAKVAASKRAAQQTASVSTGSDAKKGDLLSTATASTEQPVSGRKTVADAGQPEVCRRYSAAADGLIEIPCK